MQSVLLERLLSDICSTYDTALRSALEREELISTAEF